MRVMVFFDLPMTTAKQRKAYQNFHKELILEGFLMMQESVYVRIAVNRESAVFIENRVAQLVPAEGLIQSLIVTERQYSSMKFLLGHSSDDIRNSDEKTVII